jgi:hypothetical protein
MAHGLDLENVGDEAIWVSDSLDEVKIMDIT